MIVDIQFKSLTEENLRLIEGWMKLPHVKEVWDSGVEWDLVHEKHSLRMGSDLVKQFILYVDGKPIGYFQYYWAAKVGDGWWQGFDQSTVGIDMYLGERGYLGKGIGKASIRAFLEMIFSMPEAEQVIADPSPTNLRIQKLLQEIGFEDRGPIITPDGEARLFLIHKKRLLDESRSL
jgi:RimJ/RimL family protein N-acetyltransferase